MLKMTWLWGVWLVSPLLQRISFSPCNWIRYVNQEQFGLVGFHVFIKWGNLFDRIFTGLYHYSWDSARYHAINTGSRHKIQANSLWLAFQVFRFLRILLWVLALPLCFFFRPWVNRGLFICLFFCFSIF